MNIVDLFEKISADTWERLYLGHRFGISQGEETITDHLLLEIAKARCAEVRVIKTPKHLEGKKGTDWEWWIGSYRFGWLRYAVQAKCVDVKTNRYKKINHKVRGQFQFDLLDTYAQANRAIARYCFYNYVPLSDQTYWQCNLPFDQLQYGCTVTPLKIVRKASVTHGGKNFDFIHSYSETKPLRCLVKCPLMLSVYQGASSSFPGYEDAFVYEGLPPSLNAAFETGELREFDPDFYASEIETYPKRILVIDNGRIMESINSNYIEPMKGHRVLPSSPQADLWSFSESDKEKVEKEA
jgi:hypothetical protein